MSSRQLLEEAGDDDGKQPSVPNAQKTYGINVPGAPGAPKRPVEKEYVEVEVIPDNALLAEGNAFRYKRFVLTATQLVIPEDVTEEEWMDVGQVIRNLETSISWQAGDWADFANKVWGFDYEAIAAQFGYEVETLYSYASVARNISTLIRNQGVHFSHHRLVTKLTEQEQIYWLDLAAQHGWNLSEMKAAMNPRPALSSSEMDTFVKGYTGFAKKQLAVASRVGPSERSQMAKMLRDLAKKIEKLGE